MATALNYRAGATIAKGDEKIKRMLCFTWRHVRAKSSHDDCMACMYIVEGDRL